ncbi:molybdopterin molybdotransferase [Psychromonas sp. MB-3u-54]|uniref:molybdopterin molybdotransferase MoeA n=1 Tax=Psychromonas sp. MB-3u-54 TaxID=2058319 RepID=UPI000C343110|nr:molybdopterin molybdotransferase MoeA [Psychromonas sp. MB-3u-54]PKH02861.1 molybdopterin molybdotransferase [Psychromonas sp. MB-3u-54]
MGCCDVQGLMPFELALDKMQAALGNVCQEISQPLAQALGYALAQEIKSPLNVPSFNNSAMDGYAVNRADLINCSAEKPVTLKQVGQSFAGAPYRGQLTSGDCIRIMTGAVMPDCADSVVMQERTTAKDGLISFTQCPKLADNVRLAGEDIKLGQRVLCQGHKLTPRDIPLIASLGFADIRVFSKLKVAVISSGDELKNVGETLAEGDIYDSNRYGIIALLSRLNVDIIDFGIVKDDKNRLREAFTNADQQADVVISSGGVSVGEADFIKDILLELGSINFWKLAIKPGKPFAFGKLPSSVFFGLPGNPVSAMVTLYQLAVPAMATLSGLNPQPAIRFSAIAQEKFKKSPGRTDFQRAVYSVNDNGQLVVQSTGHQGSGVFSSMSQSNCFIVLEQDRGDVSAGETVIIEPFNALMD